MRRAGLLPSIALLGIAASWGSTFFLIKDLLDRMPALDFLAVRFAIASIVLIVIAPRAIGRLSPTSRRQAIVLGGVYGIAQILQTVGLAHTPASVSGFVTGLYVVATPLLAALLLRTRLTWQTWAAVALALVGLGVLTLDGFSIGYGEAITLLGSVMFAVHIVGLGAWADPDQALGMAIVVIAVICGLATAPGGVVLPSTGTDWWSVLYMALIAGALAMICQTWAQARLTPTRAAIIMSSEPVYAAGFAVVLGGEALTWRILVGGAIVLTAMLVVELGPAEQRTEPLPA